MSEAYVIMNPKYYFEKNEFNVSLWDYKFNSNKTKDLEIAFSKDDLKDNNFEQLVDRVISEISKNKINLSNVNITIRLAARSQQKTFTSDEWKKFTECAQKYEKLGVKFTVRDIGEYWSIAEVENANLKIDKTVGSIKQKSLSPLEQLMATYITIKNRKYTKEDNGQNPAQSRSIYGVLNSDKIVCVGYAELFTQIISKVGDKNIQIFGNTVDSIRSDGSVGGHRNLIVKIKDEKYGINGYYYLDPTWDSVNSKDLNFFMVPIQDIKSLKTQIRYNRAYDVSIGANNAKFSEKLIDLLLEDPTFMALAKERVSQTTEKKYEKNIETAIENYDRMSKIAEYMKSKNVNYATDVCFLQLMPVFGRAISDSSLYQKADLYIEEFKQNQEKSKQVLYTFIKKKIEADCKKSEKSDEFTKKQIKTMYLEFIEACEQNSNFLQMLTCLGPKEIAYKIKGDDLSLELSGGYAKDYIKDLEDYFSMYTNEINDNYIAYYSEYDKIQKAIENEVYNVKNYLKYNGTEFYDILEKMSEALPISTFQNALYEVLKKAHPTKSKEMLFNIAKETMQYNIDISKKNFTTSAKNTFVESSY